MTRSFLLWRISFLLSLGGGELVLADELTDPPLEIVDPAVVQEQEVWQQPWTEPWGTTVGWQTTEWRFGNAMDIAGQFGDDEEYLKKQQF